MSPSGTALPERRSARLLLVDADGRLLLFRYEDWAPRKPHPDLRGGTRVHEAGREGAPTLLLRIR